MVAARGRHIPAVVEKAGAGSMSLEADNGFARIRGHSSTTMLGVNQELLPPERAIGVPGMRLRSGRPSRTRGAGWRSRVFARRVVRSHSACALRRFRSLIIA